MQKYNEGSGSLAHSALCFSPEPNRLMEMLGCHFDVISYTTLNNVKKKGCRKDEKPNLLLCDENKLFVGMPTAQPDVIY